MNKDAAFFSSMVVAAISLLSSIFTFRYYGLIGGLITIVVALIWVGIGFYFRRS